MRGVPIMSEREHRPMNTAEQTKELRGARSNHEYSLAAELAQGMAQALQQGEPISDEDRRSALDQLRKKRVFGALTELARVLIAAGRADARVRRQLAQALIERG